MAHSRSRIVADGAVAGFLGAIVVAGWFLLLDIARGHPLETPALLAGTIFHGVRDGQLQHGMMLLVSEYTVMHFAAFIGVGIIGGVLLEAAENDPSLLLSLGVFLGAFEVFFIGAVMFLGPSVRAALPWWGIVVGNLMATAVMLYYFLSRHPALAQKLFGPWIKVAREGLIGGLVGALVVAVWFLVCDSIGGQPLRTPELIGSTIFGVGNLDGPAISLSLVAGYTVLHFFLFVAVGIAAAVLMAQAETEPLFVLGMMAVFVIAEVFFFGLVTLADSSLPEALGWWKIVVGNLGALAAMIAYFLKGHRGLLTRLEERWAALESDGEVPDEHSHAPHA